MSTTHKDLLAILRAALYTPGYGGRWGLPLLVWGDPGTGKTASVRALARACGLDSLALIGSTMDPADVGGYPTPGAGRYTQPLLPQWVETIDGWQSGGVLALDELTCVPPAVQAALLGVVLDGTVGGHTLDRRVRLLAMANPVDQAANGTPLALPMGNRFGHLQWVEADHEAWAAALLGATETGTPEDSRAVEGEVLRRWGPAYSRATAEVLGFLARRPELRQRTPQPGSPEAERPWPSSRTWEWAARALAGGRLHGLTADQTDTLIAAFVGEAAAAEWAVWRIESDLPVPADVLDGVVEWQPQSSRPDRTSAVLDACTALLVGKTVDRTVDEPTRLARASRYLTLLAGLEAQGLGDFAARHVARLSTDADVAKLPAMAAARRSTWSILQAQGLVGRK